MYKRLYPDWYKRNKGGNNKVLITIWLNIWLEAKDELKSILKSMLELYNSDI